MKFSVSMCVYNGDNPLHFETAIESIINQTVKPDEIVLVVDGPINEALNDIVVKYEENDLFKVIRLKENQGHGNARRIGLENCTHDIVAIMDADDISMLDRFERQVEYFVNDEEISIIGGQISEFIDFAENVVGQRIVPLNDSEIKEYAKTRCPMNLVTVMFKKSDINKVGGFIDWYCEEDYYLWLRMILANMKFANTNDILVNVRVGKEMYNRRGGWKYFKSEYALQKYMKKNKLIGFSTYFMNVMKRFIVQVLMPNKLRGYIFKKFARKSVK